MVNMNPNVNSHQQQHQQYQPYQQQQPHQQPHQQQGHYQHHHQRRHRQQHHSYHHRQNQHKQQYKQHYQNQHHQQSPQQHHNYQLQQNQSQGQQQQQQSPQNQQQLRPEEILAQLITDCINKPGENQENNKQLILKTCSEINLNSIKHFDSIVPQACIFEGLYTLISRISNNEEIILSLIILSLCTPYSWLFVSSTCAFKNYLLSECIMKIYLCSSSSQLNISNQVLLNLQNNLKQFSNINFWEERCLITFIPNTPFYFAIHSCILNNNYSNNNNIQQSLTSLINKSTLNDWLLIPDCIIFKIIHVLHIDSISHSIFSPSNSNDNDNVFLNVLFNVALNTSYSNQLKHLLNDSQIDMLNQIFSHRFSRALLHTDYNTDNKNKHDDNNSDNDDENKNQSNENDHCIDAAILDILCSIREFSSCLNHDPASKVKNTQQQQSSDTSTKNENENKEEKVEEQRNPLLELALNYPESIIRKRPHMVSTCITILTGLTDSSSRYDKVTLNALHSLLHVISTIEMKGEQEEKIIENEKTLIAEGLSFLTEENRKDNGVPAMFSSVALPLFNILINSDESIYTDGNIVDILKCIYKGRTSSKEIRDAVIKILNKNGIQSEDLVKVKIKDKNKEEKRRKKMKKDEMQMESNDSEIQPVKNEDEQVQESVDS